MRLVAAFALAGLGLAACNRPSVDAAADASASGGADAGAPITLADLPRPRAGLWQSTIDTGDGAPDFRATCLSGQSPSVGGAPKDCAQFTLRRTSAGAIVVDLTCTTPRYTMSGHTVATGDFTTQMSSDTVSTMTLAGGPPQTNKIHVDSHWVGPCAPGQKPDDLASAPAGNSAAG